MEYQPDLWIVVKITSPKKKLYKVFASWRGGYAGSDSWQMNSGIVQARLVGDVWEFVGHSGSVYCCRKDSWGTTGYSSAVLMNLIVDAKLANMKIELMYEETDWSSLDYDPLQQFISSKK
jgi:hypothetical protein